MRIKNPLDNIKYPLFSRSHGGNGKKTRASSEQNLENDYASPSETLANGKIAETKNRNFSFLSNI